jgi:hypothetical protein
MKVLLILILLNCSIVFSQSIEGKWQSLDNPINGLSFNEGKANGFDTRKPEKEYFDVTIKYMTKVVEGKNIIVLQYYSRSKKANENYAEYRIVNDTLYLGRFQRELKSVSSDVLKNEPEGIYIRIK